MEVTERASKQKNICFACLGERFDALSFCIIGKNLTAFPVVKI
jgi:hypothetical protein